MSKAQREAATGRLFFACTFCVLNPLLVTLKAFIYAGLLDPVNSIK